MLASLSISSVHLLPLMQSAAEIPPEDDFAPGLGLFVLGMLGLLMLVLFAAVAIVGAIVGASVAAVLLVVLFAVAAGVSAAVAFHVGLAAMVWSRQPPRRVWMHARWWGALTLVGGVFAAVPFYVLHYWGGGVPHSGQGAFGGRPARS